MKFFFKSEIVWVFLGSLLFLVIFNFQLFGEVFQKGEYRGIGGDSLVVQYLAETGYQDLLNFKNPFDYDQKVLYPFGSLMALQERALIQSFYFILLRPFLPIFQSLIASILISIFLAEIFMFIFLRQLKISKISSFVFSISFAFSPFISTRIQGHYPYMNYFVFPLTTYLMMQIMKEIKKGKLIFYSIFLGISVSLIAYSTMYYLAMYIMFIFFFVLFYGLFNFQKSEKYLRILITKIPYILISIFAFLLFLSPLIIKLPDVFTLGDYKPTVNWGGAVEYSAKPASFLIPSPFNPFYGQQINSFFLNEQSPEGVIYLGLLVLLGILFYLLIYKNKKSLAPIFLTGFCFYILSLGPYAYIWQFWKAYIPDPIFFWIMSVKTIRIDMPYQYLSNFPFVSLIRSPVRFALPLAFSGVILSAYVFDKLISKKTIKKFFLISALIILVIDQKYIILEKSTELKLPLKSYQLIKNDEKAGTIFEIPFVVRDGFTFLGENSALGFMRGQLIHNKPVLGGYLARVNDYKLNYFRQNPAVFYYGSLIDEYAKIFTPKRKIKKPPLEKIEKSLIFLQVKYILLDTRISDYRSINEDLSRMDYKKIISDDNGFNLYFKNNKENELLYYDFSNDDEYSQLFGSWSETKSGGKLITGTRGGIFLKSANSQYGKIKIKAGSVSSIKKIKFVLNNKIIAQEEITKKEAEYKIPAKLNEGINRIDLIVDSAYSDFDPLSLFYKLPEIRVSSVVFEN